MWQRIKNWFKEIKWIAIIDSDEAVFFYPLAVFMVLVFVDLYNPLKWIVLGIWVLLICRNYKNPPLA